MHVGKVSRRKTRRDSGNLFLFEYGGSLAEEMSYDLRLEIMEGHPSDMISRLAR